MAKKRKPSKKKPARKLPAKIPAAKKRNKGGAPKGNTNAVKHGLYSKMLKPTERLLYEKILAGEYTLEEELAMCRVRLYRVFNLELQQWEALYAKRAKAINETQYKKAAVIDQLVEKITTRGGAAIEAERSVTHKVHDWGAMAHRIINEMCRIQNVILMKQGLDPMSAYDKAAYIQEVVGQFKAELEGK